MFATGLFGMGRFWIEDTENPAFRGIVAVIATMLPWQCILWVNAEGTEKPAQGCFFGILLGTAALILVYNPSLSMWETGLLCLGIGSIMSLTCIIVEKRAAVRIASLRSNVPLSR